ncbi:MAG TPA: PVC-type heme-binding CxxCH protein, partial [Methylomirabilota bacterium]|nr:PVC-type heme-binding CxxCH protein [Methylomirabilota bacterium]
KGRLFVVEMTDYPSGPEGGRVRLLEDRDHDGKYRATSIFADGLSFPTSVLPWRDGILVTAAPDIWFLQDTDGDNRADVRRKLLTGFTEGNQQLRVSGLFFGLDNWIYGANGRSDGNVRWSDSPAGAEISIRRRDFRFRPDTRDFQAVAGNSQFGMGFDDWGNRFPVFNNLPVRQVVIDEELIAPAKLPNLPDLVPSITTGGTELFPLTEANLLVPQPPGFTTSACGPVIYRGDRLAPEYYGDIFVCEPVQNLVHRRKLVPNGVLYSAERVETQREFLRSSDPWFHGVFMANGPDGHLYIADFYREFVEHPHWVAEELQRSVDWRKGEAHGRIWRIKHKGDNRPVIAPALAARSGAQLVEALSAPNGWERETAHRLIFERQDGSAIPTLRSLLRDRVAVASARVHALHALEGLKALEDADITHAYTDSNPWVRAAALRLAGQRLRQGGRERLVAAMLTLQNDSDPRVLLELALALIPIRHDGKARALAAMASRSSGESWLELAIFAAASATATKLARALPDDPALEPLLRKLGEASGQKDNDTAGKFLALAREKSQTTRLAMLHGLAEGMRARSVPGRDFASANPNLRSIVQEASEVVGSAANPSVRADAFAFLAWIDPGAAQEKLPKMLEASQPAIVQDTAARLAPRLMETPAQSAAVVHGWANYRREVRQMLMASGAKSSSFAAALLEGVAEGRISASELDATTRASLLKHSDRNIQAVAAERLPAPVSERGKVVEEYAPALKLTGSPAAGARLFARLCAQCHAMHGVGAQVGPELSGVSLRAPSSLLNDIINPSGQVLPDYTSFTLLKKTGEVVQGFITHETGESVTLRRPNAPDETVPRTEIAELKAEGQSLMPDGLEAGMSHQEMADLISFLQRPTRALLHQALSSGQ